jgi:hypothetical protein
MTRHRRFGSWLQCLSASGLRTPVPGWRRPRSREPATPPSAKLFMRPRTLTAGTFLRACHPPGGEIPPPAGSTTTSATPCPLRPSPPRHRARPNARRHPTPWSGGTGRRRAVAQASLPAATSPSKPLEMLCAWQVNRAGPTGRSRPTPTPTRRPANNRGRRGRLRHSGNTGSSGSRRERRGPVQRPSLAGGDVGWRALRPPQVGARRGESDAPPGLGSFSPPWQRDRPEDELSAMPFRSKLGGAG